MSSGATEKKVIDNKEYTLCTETFLTNSDSAWTHREQIARFASLREKGLIQTVNLKLNTRWVYIDYKKIEDAIDTALGIQLVPNGLADFGTNQSVPKRTGNKKNTSYSSKKGRNKKCRFSNDAGEMPSHTLVDALPNQQETFSTRISKKARSVFTKVSKIRSVSISVWAKYVEMYVLDVMSRRSMDRQSAEKYVEAVYENHFNMLLSKHPYIVDAFSTRGVYDKYDKLEKALERSQRRNSDMHPRDDNVC